MSFLYVLVIKFTLRPAYVELLNLHRLYLLFCINVHNLSFKKTGLTAGIAKLIQMKIAW